MNRLYALWFKWLPWRYFIRKAALAHGFLDPISLLSHLHRFSQPSEVTEPIELLRAGAVFHARGLINTKTIQHNLDWVWPYWVVRQFDPEDPSFIPRAFSMTHINLTNRNWTAVGIPDSSEYPIVDPSGLCTPFWDGWSIDAWIIGDDGTELIPSRGDIHSQRLEHMGNLAVVTEIENEVFYVRSTVTVPDNRSLCEYRIEARSKIPARLIVSLRPYNPEGVSFMHHIDYSESGKSWTIDNTHSVFFDQKVSAAYFSHYKKGDVYYDITHHKAHHEFGESEVTCDVGMATAAAEFTMKPNETRSIQATVKDVTVSSSSISKASSSTQRWKDAVKESECTLVLPFGRYQELYDIAVRTLILLTPEESYPGPYTYKRFWYRDATFILHALLCLGFVNRVRKSLEHFPLRQTHAGYFLSQEGEWDSNGQVLWLYERYLLLSGNELPDACAKTVQKAAEWICNKRVSRSIDAPHAGLLPAGFSAEHLGPNDYYFWDDFWAVAGLRATARLLSNEVSQFTEFVEQANSLLQDIAQSLRYCEKRLESPAMPASPYRRMDSGAIGSIVAGYPLQLLEPHDPRLTESIKFLLNKCFVKGTFYQDMIHSGSNPYLTLHVAQVLLRSGDSRFESLIKSVADLASPTGQWPEAIHPGTGGGCMGDGQHAWATAEWLMIIRNCFVREENDTLVLASGIVDSWISSGSPVSFGPALTSWGAIHVHVEKVSQGVEVRWESTWHDSAPPQIEVALPNFEPVKVPSSKHSIVVNA